VDRREFFWEDQDEFQAGEFFEALLKQIYLDNAYIPASIHVPVDIEERDELEDFLSEKKGRRVEIVTPQRGQKKALLGLVETNAKHSFEQRFRVMKPSSKAVQDAFQEALNLPESPDRIECFDISHIQGTDKVASMVVWEDGKMKKADYRKFIIRTVVGNDDFASMREVITRRYSRIQAGKRPHAGLNSHRRRPGPVARGRPTRWSGWASSTTLGLHRPSAKRSSTCWGMRMSRVVLDKFSPILHLIQRVRDEAHRFAVTFHRTRRNAARLTSELDQIPMVGEKTVRKLLKHFGSSELVRVAPENDLAALVGRAVAKRVRTFYDGNRTTV
jgi:excinuclease ABC subunit C